MAGFSVLLCFLVLIFSFSVEINGRENFSKFTHVVQNTNQHVKETILPDKANKDKLVQPPKPKQQQDPAFLPETTDNGYGLYGHETNTPINNNNNNNNNAEKYYYTDKEYEESVEQEDMVDPSLLENEYTTTPTSNNNNNYYYDNRDNNNDVYNPRNMPYNNRQQQDNNVYGRRYNKPSNQYNTENYNTGGDRRQYNTERQGMSDTRYVENGRYFYDVNDDDKNYYRNGNKGYYGNNNNNENSYGQGNQNMYP